MIKVIINLALLFVCSDAFSTNQPTIKFSASTVKSTSRLSAIQQNNSDNDDISRIVDNSNIFTSPLSTRILTSAAVSFAILTSPLHNTFININSVANADEWGIETEAPTLFTGETTMICKKRGPLGACLETTVRTADNDNDKALKYFKDPAPDVKRKQERMLTQLDEDSEGNTLIQKLRKQSVDNKDKNDQAVQLKTQLNDQGASFGPFSQQVVILNTDGSTFTLLQNPQAMRLKKAGYIEDRKFVIQPSQQVIDDALEGESLGDALKGIFGGKEEEEAIPVSNEVVLEEKSVDVVAVEGEESVVVEESSSTASAE